MSTIRLSSNAAAVTAQLNAFPRAMLVAVGRALDEQNEITVGEIQKTKLQTKGPLTLQHVTGRLSRSIRPSPARVLSDGVVSSIGSNVKYAGVHEYGFDGPVNVSAHQRRFRQRDVYSLTSSYREAVNFRDENGRISRVGRVLKKEVSIRVGDFSKETGRKAKLVATGFVSVGTFTRHMRLPARRYIGRTIEERSDAYSQAISAAVLAAWSGPTS